jgi:ribonuclease VapC
MCTRQEWCCAPGTARPLSIACGASFEIENDFEIVPFDEAQVRAAAAAFDRYGRGIHSMARLNLADCAAYALAMTMNAPLLFKGDDFSATEVRACL